MDDLNDRSHHVQPGAGGHIMVRDGGNAFVGQYYMQPPAESAYEHALKQLAYPGERNRYEQIEPAYSDTYQWLFAEDGQGPDSTRSSTKRFLKFLRSDQAIFWVTGKPGSGKSSLMKFLATHASLLLELKPWHGANSTLRILTHCFWKPATEVLQKNYVGFLRSMIRQIFRALGKEAYHNFADSMQSSLDISLSTTHGLSNLLHQALQAKLQSYFFLVIDGLDEMEDSGESREQFRTLLHTISQLSHVKICVSSRPELVFVDAFQDVDRLQMEQVNADDMLAVITTRFSRYKFYERQARMDPEIAGQIVQRLCAKAEGVFLWLRLVLNKVCELLENHMSLPKILSFVEEMKGELYDLFYDLLKRQTPLARSKCASFCLLLLADRSGSDVEDSVPKLDGLFCALLMSDKQFSDELFLQLTVSPIPSETLETFHEHLDECCTLLHCSGLIDFSKTDYRFEVRSRLDVGRPGPDLVSIILYYTSFELRFIDRSAADFFVQNPNARTLLDAAAESDLLGQQLWIRTMKQRFHLCAIAYLDVVIRFRFAPSQSTRASSRNDPSGSTGISNDNNAPIYMSNDLRVLRNEMRASMRTLQNVIVRRLEKFPYQSEISRFYSEMRDAINSSKMLWQESYDTSQLIWHSLREEDYIPHYGLQICRDWDEYISSAPHDLLEKNFTILKALWRYLSPSEISAHICVLILAGIGVSHLFSKTGGLGSRRHNAGPHRYIFHLTRYIARDCNDTQRAEIMSQILDFAVKEEMNFGNTLLFYFIEQNAPDGVSIRIEMSMSLRSMVRDGLSTDLAPANPACRQFLRDAQDAAGYASVYIRPRAPFQLFTKSDIQVTESDYAPHSTEIWRFVLREAILLCVGRECPDLLVGFDLDSSEKRLVSALQSSSRFRKLCDAAREMNTNDILGSSDSSDSS